MTRLLKQYELGDMQALYYLNAEGGNVELLLLPSGAEAWEREVDEAHDHTDHLVQVKLAGDMYTGCYSPGISLRVDKDTDHFVYDSQRVKEEGPEKEIITVLKDERGYLSEHHLIFKEGGSTLRSFSVFKNQGNTDVSLELLSSFSLGKISPFMEGDGHDTLRLHRLRSVWSMEGRKESIALEDLQLEPSWAGHAVRCERFGATGSYAVNKFFPIMALEDQKNHIFWGASLAHNASWQMEVYRRGEEVGLSGGLADREFGHWMKKVSPGEEFKTPEAYLSVCGDDDEEEIFQRLTSALDEAADNGPLDEQSLPVLFNEYCTTWGNPSHQNISDIVEKIKGKGFSYFVIDCGWYKEPSVSWDISMGDYKVSKELFPEGLDKTTEMIKAAGMKPGLWFEIDNVGSASKAYQDIEHLLKRDGQVLTTTSRRFWDLRQEEVIEELSRKVIGTLKEYGFEYIKIDCNDTVGIGCDGAESLGEGLRQNAEASADFVDRMLSEIPGIVIENCASGGHKLEPLMMSKCAMASFSDAHECEEIPIIAANLHRAILPRQSQIWAVIREEDSLRRIAYSIANTFLGRMCLSGDVLSLSAEQWELIDRGIAFYKKLAPIIKKGKTGFYGPKITSYRHPKGWQGIFRESGDKTKAFLLLHGFLGARGEKLNISVPEDYKVADIYSYKDENVSLKDGMVSYVFDEDMKAVCLYLEKQ